LTFAFSLSMVLILEFSASVASFALQNNIIDLLNEKINYTMHQYGGSNEAKEAIDFLQARLHCCGYNGPKDWEGILTNESSVHNTPVSCCNWLYGASEENGCVAIYQHGCYHGLALIVNRSALYLITGATMIALIQLAGIMFACMLGRAIRKQKTQRERRRWQMRQSLLSGYQPLGKTDPLTTFPVVYMRNNNVNGTMHTS